MTLHFHITGASGAGVTTLGRALADRLHVPHHDTDDYYWLPTDPAFQRKRPIPERLRLMQDVFIPRDAWVLSGSLDGWGDPLMDRLDLVIFLYTPTEIRLDRLRHREARRLANADSAAGTLPESSTELIEWAAHYDDGTREGRSLPRHEAWLARLDCPVLRLDGASTVVDLVEQIDGALNLRIARSGTGAGCV